MKITLKDNVIAEVSKGTTVALVAEYISESLAKNAICGKINGRLVDLNASLGKNCKLEIITIKDKDAVNVLWHSSSHILAQAVKSVFPNTKLGSGGYDETGFYYDFDFKSPVSEADFSIIEDEMQKIIKANFSVVRAGITKEQAILLAEENGEPYKMELLNNYSSGEEVGLYTQGDFSDFCDGPHLKSTGIVKAFKLVKIEKSSFSSSVSKKSLTRIYGVSFFYKKDLDKYLKTQEIIAKRNHLVLGENLGYFGVDDVTSDIILLPKGQRVISTIKDFVKDLGETFNYEEVSSTDCDNNEKDEILVKSYRVTTKKDFSFPLRYYIGEQHMAKSYIRDSGLFNCKKNRRHKFVSFAKLSDFDAEIKNIIDMTIRFYSSFGLNLGVKLYVGDDELIGGYSKIKTSLKRILDRKIGDGYIVKSDYSKLDVIKVEYILTDLLSREWVVGNLYIDLTFSQKNNIAYTEDGVLMFPITIVNNLCKSYEKLFAILIESYSGVLPYWLSPLPLKLITNTEKTSQKAKKIILNLRKYKVYAVEDFKEGNNKASNEFLCTAFIGEKELEDKTVKVICDINHEEKIVSIKKFMQELVVGKLNKNLEVPKF